MIRTNTFHPVYGSIYIESTVEKKTKGNIQFNFLLLNLLNITAKLMICFNSFQNKEK